jgi:hypothetical protein
MVDSGGVDLGTFGQLQGTLPGLNTITRLASRTPEWKELGSQWKAQQQQQPGKDFNDQPVGHLAGASNGNPTYGPPGGWSGAAGELGGLL